MVKRTLLQSANLGGGLRLREFTARAHVREVEKSPLDVALLQSC
jgi:hypothetical protein